MRQKGCFALLLYDSLHSTGPTECQKILVGASLYDIKSDSTQDNKLGRWVDGTNDWSTKCLMFQVLLFFIKSWWGQAYMLDIKSDSNSVVVVTTESQYIGF